MSDSALLRQCRNTPVFLKLGGLLLTGGGICLFGSGVAAPYPSGNTWVAALTALTGPLSPGQD